MKHSIFFLLIFSPINIGASGLDNFNSFMNDLKTFEAQFEHSILDTENSRQGLFRGNFWLERPNKFRWNYLAPMKKNIIADGNDLWVIDFELDQVSQYYQPWALQDTPISILLSNKVLDDTFKIVELGEKNKMQWLELIPNNPTSEIVRVLIAFQNNNLSRLEMTDNFGQISRFSFYDTKKNLPIPEKIFKYKPPEDLDIFYQD